MQHIGVNNGVETSRKVEDALHPTYPAGFGANTGRRLLSWDMRAATLELLIGNSNELIADKATQDAEIAALAKRVAAVEARPQTPFPGSS